MAQAGVDPALIERHGAVSPEVADALAAGAVARFGADLGIGVTGIAGPGGGTPEKPVGTVCLCVAGRRRGRLDRTLQLPGDRADVRDRTTTAALHLLRRLLLGPDGRRGVSDQAGAPPRAPLRRARPARRRRAPRSSRSATQPPTRRLATGPDRGAARHARFLGHRPASDVRRARRGPRAAAGPAPRLALAGPLLLPPRRAARAVRRARRTPTAARRAAGARQRRLAAAGSTRPRSAPFRAHVTVARLRPRARAPRSRRAAAEPLAFDGEALTLFGSRLDPHGARYEPLVRVALASPDASRPPALRRIGKIRASSGTNACRDPSDGGARLVGHMSTQDAKARDAALQGALTQIERQFGKGTVMRMGDEGAQVKVDAIPTGALSLDIALGIGGMPARPDRRDLRPGVLRQDDAVYHIIAEAQKLGGVCAFIDAEHAMDPLYAKNIGVNIDELLVSQPDYGEQALEIADMLVRSGAVDSWRSTRWRR